MEGGDEAEAPWNKPRRRRTASEPPRHLVEDGPCPGGGIEGLSVRVNILGEGLERTQAFLGGAAAEAEEILQAAFERIGILHARLSRVEGALGLESPPGSPRQEGARSPRSAVDVEEAARAAATEATSEAASEAQAAQAEGGAEAPESNLGPFGGCMMPGSEAQGWPEGVGGCSPGQRRRGSRRRASPGEAEGIEEGTCSTSPTHPATASTSCPTSENASNSSEGRPPSCRGTGYPVAELVEGLRARAGAVESDVRALDEKVLEANIRRLVQEALSDRVVVGDASETPPAADMLKAELGQALQAAEDVLREDLGALVSSEVRAGIAHAVAAVEEGVREDLAAYRWQASEELKEQLVALRARLADVVGGMEAQGAGLSCLEARLDAHREETACKVADIGACAARALEESSAATASLRVSHLRSPSRLGESLESACIAEEGQAQAITALARVLGLLRKGEVLGSGEWSWDCAVGRRLEQVWHAKTLELDVVFLGSTASAASAPAVRGGSAGAPVRAHIFDLLRAVATGQGTEAAAHGRVGANLPDRREAARLQAWLQAPAQRPPSPSRGLAATAPPRPSSASASRPPLAQALAQAGLGAQPGPGAALGRLSQTASPASISRALSASGLEQAVKDSFASTMPASSVGSASSASTPPDDVRCGSGFRALAASRRAASASGGGCPLPTAAQGAAAREGYRP